jgi:hypothetical protein
MSDNERTVVHVFEKGAGQRIEASISTYKDQTYADVRTYFEGDGGEWKPTKKGITVPLDLLGELEASVQALRQAVGELDE